MTQLKWCFSRIHSKVFVPKILKSTFIWKLDKNEQIWGRRWLTSFISRKPRRKGRETRGYCWPRFVTVRHERWEDERTRWDWRDEARTKQISKTRYQGFHLLLDARAPLKRYSSTVRPFIFLGPRFFRALNYLFFWYNFFYWEYMILCPSLLRGYLEYCLFYFKNLFF